MYSLSYLHLAIYKTQAKVALQSELKLSNVEPLPVVTGFTTDLTEWKDQRVEWVTFGRHTYNSEFSELTFSYSLTSTLT